MHLHDILLSIFFLSVTLLMPASASAQSLESYTLDFFMAYNNIVVQKEMVFNSPISGSFVLAIPKDAKGISLYIDDEHSEAVVKDSRISMQLDSMNKLKVSYTTKELTEKSEFILSTKMPYDTATMRVTLVLPEDTNLESPLPESDVDVSPVYPLPKEAVTDGRQIKLVWEYEGLKKGDEKSFFVKFRKNSSDIWIILLLIVVVLSLISIVIYLMKRPQKETVVEKVVEKVVHEEGDIEKHLKEDEEQVYNILKQREGQCEQGTLRVITGFSKAKLSGLLKELEDRNVIHKEKRGKKNLVFLRDM